MCVLTHIRSLPLSFLPSSLSASSLLRTTSVYGLFLSRIWGEGKVLRRPRRQNETWEGVLKIMWQSEGNPVCVLRYSLATYVLMVAPLRLQYLLICIRRHSNAFETLDTFSPFIVWGHWITKNLRGARVGVPHLSLLMGLMDGQFQQQEIITACQPPPIQILICVYLLPACHKWPQGHVFPCGHRVQMCLCMSNSVCIH